MLRFHGRLKLPSVPPMRFADQLSDFARYMTEEQGLSPYSVRSHCWKTSKFLAWFGERAGERRRRGRLPRAERCKRMESQVHFRGCAGACGRSSGMPRHAAGVPPALRKGFKHQESTNMRTCPKPDEKEVRQLLRSVKKRSGDEGKSPGDVRSEAAARSKTLAGQSRPAHAPGSTLSQLM